MRQFTQLHMPHPRRRAPYRQHTAYFGVQQAFPQYGLADHAGGAEDKDVHEVFLSKLAGELGVRCMVIGLPRCCAAKKPEQPLQATTTTLKYK
jgi:hypothetical protein